jgi:hypothetical protein
MATMYNITVLLTAENKEVQRWNGLQQNDGNIVLMNVCQLIQNLLGQTHMYIIISKACPLL